MNRILITQYKNKILSALWNGNRVLEFQAEDPDSRLKVGDIYVGKVSSFVKNLNAVFVEVRPGVNCFYQMKDGEILKVGEELPVQITREAVKTKAACCSRALSLPGKYLVLVSDKQEIAVSTKLSSVRRAQLKQQLADFPGRFGAGFIVRTNAGDAPDQVLVQEAEYLAARYQEILTTAVHRTRHTLLHAGIPTYLTLLQDAPIGSIDEIVTDIPEIHQEIAAYMEGAFTSEKIRLRLYQDPSLSMASLYRLEHWLSQALDRRVWLPSGGYLIIEPTEALTVIDVNTGKYSGHKDKDDAFYKINTEAAEEIALQMRLRNLSGIILVDFIDLQSEEYKTALYDHLKKLLNRDPVKSVLVDITPLHLAEITRKKVRKTLWEQLNSRNDA